MKSKVYLLSHTPNPEKVVAYSANLCYSKSDIESTCNKFYDEKEVERLVNKLRDKGHMSTFEHVSFTFGIENISRVTSHQLVRHRIASYSQQSQRYVVLKDTFDYIVPDSIKNSEYYDEYCSYMEKGKILYDKMKDSGIKKEDARYILSNATTTNIIVTMNARALLNFFELRCCNHAQWEIRQVANKMLKQVKDVAPLLFKDAGPTCVMGFCREKDKKCPRYKALIQKNEN